MLNLNNLVILKGNLGNDVELRHTRADVPVANFSLATNEFYRDLDGKRQQRTEWHKITVWGTCAELCEKHLELGQEVTILGKLQTRKWQDDKGIEHFFTEVHTVNVQFGRKPQDYDDDDNEVEYSDE